MFDMRIVRLAEKTRVASLVVALFLCLAALLYSHQFAGLTPGSGTLAAPTMEHSSPADNMGATGDGHTQTVGYLPAALEEAETSDEAPVNAEYLTALLLMVFFGAVLGLLFGGRMWRRDEALLLSERRLTPIVHHLPPRPSSSRLSVFLL